ncbi:MAG: transposase zinc-binding domain-containing protein [Geminicoccaceae bacterium]
MCIAPSAARQVEIADIFRRHGGDYRERVKLRSRQARAMTAIEQCRTSAMGGHLETCDHCDAMVARYHSCLMGKIRNGELANFFACSGRSFRQLRSPLRSALEQGDQLVWRPEGASP